MRGLIVNRFTTGINLEGGGVKVLGNFIGTDSAGATALGNSAGIVAPSDGGQQIGSALRADRNVISGNSGGAIFLTNHTSDTNTVQNNYIGVNAAGDAALPNDGSGIFLNGISGTQGPTVIGGSLAAPGSGEGNVISGNGSDGIAFNAGGGATMGAVTIGGNIIGLGADGTTAIGNGASGIEDQTDIDATIGALLIRQNIISSNAVDGIRLRQHEYDRARQLYRHRYHRHAGSRQRFLRHRDGWRPQGCARSHCHHHQHRRLDDRRREHDLWQRRGRHRHSQRQRRHSRQSHRHQERWHFRTRQ